MKGLVLASGSLKGGVGKTAAIINLAWLSAREGPALLWDLDPQGSASFCLGVEPWRGDKAGRLLKGRASLLEMTHVTPGFPLAVIPADTSLRNPDILLDGLDKPGKGIKRLVAEVQDRYRWIWIDCPPGISLLTESVARAVDGIIAPLVPAPLSVSSFASYLAFLEDRGFPPERVHPFFSLVQGRKKIHRDMMAASRGRWPSILGTEIPFRAEAEAAGPLPLSARRPASLCAQAYLNLFQELKDRTTV